MNNVWKLKLNRGGLVLRKHSPEILLGAGLVGVVVTIVMASKATLKVQAIMDEKHNELLLVEKSLETKREANTATIVYTEEDALRDKAIIYVQTGLKLSKLYGPSVGVGLLSVAAILASHGIMHNRQVALVGAYNLLAQGFKNYCEQVVDQLGEEQDRLFANGLRAETVTEKETDEEGKTRKTKKTKLVTNGKATSIYSRFYAKGTTPQWRGDRALDKAFLIAQQNYLNDVLIIRGHVFLNEVYDALGFPHTKEGAIVGWVLGSNPERNIGDGYIDFGLANGDVADMEFINGDNDAILLDFNVDGIIFDLI